MIQMLKKYFKYSSLSVIFRGQCLMCHISSFAEVLPTFRQILQLPPSW